MTLTIDYADIKETEEYQQEVEFLKALILNSLGNDAVFNSSNALIHAVANLVAMQRYFINHLPEVGDIDVTPFIELIKSEVGTGLPLTASVPLTEFLRENKVWFGSVGTEKLYRFAGNLIGSPVRVDYPFERLFEVDSENSLIDGEDGSEKDFKDSKLGIIEDGVFWTDFTYLVTVTQEQNTTDISDLFEIIRRAHAVGTKYFLRFERKTRATNHQSSARVWNETRRECGRTITRYPTIDNGLLVDDTESSIDFTQHKYWGIPANFLEILSISRRTSYRKITHDRYLHDQLTGRRNTAFSRRIPNTDDTYTKVYSDTDAILFENATTNMGLKDYPVAAIANKTFKEIQHIAWDKDGKNTEGQYCPYLVRANHTEII